MPCRKTLSLSGACELETCTTEASRAAVGTDLISDESLAYASDLCYAMFMARNAANTETYVYRYDPATNTAVKKATIAGTALPTSRVVYDAAHQQFVWCNGSAVPGTIYMFDPSTDAVTSFAPGIGSLWEFVYVPQKGLVYGEMGVDGGGNTYIGYLDLDLQLVVQLGIIPDVGASKPVPRNLVYVTSTDSLYGCWVTGLGASMSRFDLATNTGTGSIVLGGIEGNEICLDTDQNRLIVHYGTVKEVNPATGAVAFTGVIPGDRSSIEFTPYYSSTLKKVFGVGDDLVTGGYAIESYNTQDKSTSIVFGGDVDHSYYAICKFSQGSCLSEDYNDPGNIDGVRRLCLT